MPLSYHLHVVREIHGDVYWPVEFVGSYSSRSSSKCGSISFTLEERSREIKCALPGDLAAVSTAYNHKGKRSESLVVCSSICISYQFS